MSFFCWCCWHWRPLHQWMKWGTPVPVPICMYCKYAGCDRCNKDLFPEENR